MGILRSKILAAFLAGVLFTLGVLTVRDYVAAVTFRLDRIEQYLTQQSMMQRIAPQAAPQSHKGEMRKPQQWKV